MLSWWYLQMSTRMCAMLSKTKLWGKQKPCIVSWHYSVEADSWSLDAVTEKTLSSSSVEGNLRNRLFQNVGNFYQLHHVTIFTVAIILGTSYNIRQWACRAYLRFDLKFQYQVMNDTCHTAFLRTLTVFVAHREDKKKFHVLSWIEMRQKFL